MKYLDKLLKILKTDRNTFFTYIFTLASLYVVVDRVAEMVIMIFTGISVSYWGPITYTLALACPVFAFLFSGSSKYGRGGDMKLMIIYSYAIALYLIGISMFMQWINMAGWLFLFSLPNYVEIVTNFASVIRPAFQAVAFYLPITTFFSMIWITYAGIADTRTLKESVWDYTGINLSKKSTKKGAYSYENVISIDKETGGAVKINDSRRCDPILISGASGMGKTALLVEPMLARDIEKKYFFREAAKEVGFTALKTGLANINCPYTNDYINENFSLNMLEPVSGKEKLYKAYLSKLIHSESPKIVYKDIGMTYVSPDYESIERMLDVAKNFNVKVNIVDPNDSNSIGLNPFSYGAPGEIAAVISLIISSTYMGSHPAEDEAFFLNSASQAVQNLTIILADMYPRLHDGQLPTIEDMLDMLNDFDLVVDMCKLIEEDPELRELHKLPLGYFKKHFYNEGIMRQETEKYVHLAVTQLDALLRVPGLRSMLCNRTNNINFDTALANGEVTMVCTRRGDLGPVLHQAFGLFFLLAMQRSVLKRPGNENTRIPHILYIDDFPEFLSGATLGLVTLYRKYNVGTIVTTQSLEQLKKTPTSEKTIISNTTAKFVLGNISADEIAFWSDQFGDKRDWLFSQDMSIKGEGKGGQFLMGEGSVSSVSYGDLKGVKWGYKKKFDKGKFDNMKFRDCGFMTKDDSGKSFVGLTTLDFMASKYKEPHKEKKFDFEKFQTGIVSKNDSVKTSQKNSGFKAKNIDFDSFSDSEEVDPVQTDLTDSEYLFNNEDAIIYNIKKDPNE